MTTTEDRTTFQADLDTSPPELFGVQPSSDVPIPLTLPAYELASLLKELAPLNEPLDIPNDVDRSPVTELRRKGVIRTLGGTRGRPGQVALLVEHDRLVVSQRRRPSGIPVTPVAPAAKTRRPTVDELRVFIAAIDAAEKNLCEQLSAEIEERVTRIKRELMDAKNGSSRERELFEQLRDEMNRLETLSAEIRTQVLERIENEGGSLAPLVALISRE